LIAWGGGILLRGAGGGFCGGKTRDVGLRADGCAILGAGGGVGGGVGFVGDDSVSLVGATERKKKQSTMESYARASRGAAVLRPYMDFGVGFAVVADQEGASR
jgi:hypothetical protein